MDKIRFIEMKSRNYWNDFYINASRQGGSYFGRVSPIFNYAILQDVVLLYSNHHKIAYYEIYNWETKTIHSCQVDGGSDFWELPGFEKLKAIESNTHGTTTRDNTERQWE